MKAAMEYQMKRFHFRVPFLTALLALGLTAAVGCPGGVVIGDAGVNTDGGPGDGDGDAGPGDGDGDAGPGDGDGDMPTATIGAEGGSIAIFGASAAVPANALAAPVELSVKRIQNMVAIPDGYASADGGYAYGFEPYTQTFTSPVTIKLPYQGPNERLYIYRLDDEADTTWEQLSGPTFGGGYGEYASTSFGVFAVLRKDEDIVPPPLDGLTVSGTVYDWSYVASTPQDGAKVRFKNTEPVDAPGTFIEAAPTVNGQYSVDYVPPGSNLAVEIQYDQIIEGTTIPVIPAVESTQIKKVTQNEDVVHNLYTVKFNWLAQVAYDCGLYASVEEARTEPGGNSINLDWVSRSAVVGTIKDAAGAGVAGVAQDAVRVTIEGYENYHNSGTSKLCWLNDDGGDTYVGTTSAVSYASGRFAMFQVQNAANGIGQGIAYVTAEGYDEVSVTLGSAGNIGFVTLTEADNPLPPPDPDAIDFETTVYPLFTKYGCVGCHYAGGNAAVDQGGYPADFSGDPQSVYDNLTGPGTDCQATPYRVCVNTPEAATLVTKPLAEPVGVPPNHPNTSFDTVDDPDLQYIIQWMAQGAARYAVPPVVGDEVSLEAVITLSADIGCTTCHDANGPDGGLPLNGCIQALIDDGTYAGANVDTNDPQNCVYYHLKNQGVADDPYAYGYRVNPDTPEYSMLLRNPYCGPNGCAADPTYPESHPVRVFFGNDPENADNKSAAYAAIYKWIEAGALNNKDADL